VNLYDRWSRRRDLPGPGFLRRDGVSVTGATWNNADKSGSVTLSNGNLTAAKNAVGYGGVRSTSSKSSGLYHIEWTGGTTSPNFGIGIGNGAAAFTNFVGGTANSIGIFPTGTVWRNNTNLGGTTATYANGATRAIEINVDGKLIRFARSDGSWTIDFDFSAITGPYFLFWSSDVAADAITLNTTGTFTVAPSSNYGVWA
jgi:hypothetical protein